MVSTGAITEAQATRAGHTPLPRRVHRDDEHYPAPYAVSAAVQQLLDDPRLGATRKERENAIFRGGLHIRLTIDPNEQESAEAAVSSVLVRRADPDAAVASVQPGNGAIRALVGGRDYWSHSDPTAKVNLAYGGTTKRQAGSTFKVFDLITALEHGIKPEDSFATGTNVVIPRTVGPDWNVSNYEGEAFGTISLRTATELSVNTAYARVVTAIGDGDPDAGAAAVVTTAEKLGITGAGGSKLRVDPSTTLGAQEVDPVAMAGAYATLAANGIYAAPYLVAEVRDARGKVLIRANPKPHRVIPKGIAAMANDVLQGVVREGTGVRARLPRPVAGKTGTAQGYHDAWFVGYTPNFAAAVWMGVATGEVSMTPENGFPLVIAGGTLPAEIWRRFAGTALLGKPAPAFTVPDGATVDVRIDVIRDCVPNQWTPQSAIETKTYLQGTQPRDVCTVPIGRPPTTLPSMLGLAEEEATRRLEQYGFIVRTVDAYDRNYPVGTVTGQTPSSDEPVEPGATVTLTVAAHSDVSSTVPDLLGLTTLQAEHAIEQAGFVADLTVEESCHGPSLRCTEENAAVAGKVWRQDIARGTRLPVGSRIPLTVGPTG
jgi:membrane peptidoglycan carboxypeptidase